MLPSRRRLNPTYKRAISGAFIESPLIVLATG